MAGSPNAEINCHGWWSPIRPTIAGWCNLSDGRNYVTCGGLADCVLVAGFLCRSTLMNAVAEALAQIRITQMFYTSRKTCPEPDLAAEGDLVSLTDDWACWCWLLQCSLRP